MRSKFCLIISVCSHFLLTACTGIGSFVGNSGPTTNYIHEKSIHSNIKIRDIDRDLNRDFFNSIQEEQKALIQYFNSTDYKLNPTFIAKGDVLSIRIIESSPAILFQKSNSFDSAMLNRHGYADFVLDDLRVDYRGQINFPFIGRFSVDGKTTQEIEEYISDFLKKKANNPQVLVEHKVINTNFVSLVGDVKNSRKISINNRSFSVLDVINDSLSVGASLSNLELIVYRNNKSISFPVNNIFSKPEFNFNLHDKDVVSIVDNPYKVFIMGAVKTNSEVKFSSNERSLASILVKSGGFNDLIADPEGVFVFRRNSSDMSNNTISGDVFTLDMKSPESFILASEFMVSDGDVIYVASATSAELQKFINIISSSVFSITGLRN